MHEKGHKKLFLQKVPFDVKWKKVGAKQRQLFTEWKTLFIYFLNIVSVFSIFINVTLLSVSF